MPIQFSKDLNSDAKLFHMESLPITVPLQNVRPFFDDRNELSVEDGYLW